MRETPDNTRVGLCITRILNWRGALELFPSYLLDEGTIVSLRVIVIRSSEGDNSCKSAIR